MLSAIRPADAVPHPPIRSQRTRRTRQCVRLPLACATPHPLSCAHRPSLSFRCSDPGRYPPCRRSAALPLPNQRPRCCSMCSLATLPLTTSPRPPIYRPPARIRRSAVTSPYNPSFSLHRLRASCRPACTPVAGPPRLSPPSNLNRHTAIARYAVQPISTLGRIHRIFVELGCIPNGRRQTWCRAARTSRHLNVAIRPQSFLARPSADPLRMLIKSPIRASLALRPWLTYAALVAPASSSAHY
ncbi:hypothetical protein HYPSUDRAFT_1045683 [Hypholoma sublateritium FD-334 SS-4]|uniref:Uncharacterized protein n=1 Tax=Hypholoma sublateritium (strain FD-334 SS-4) TaxID=945553 RepID=A0A0D2NK64_HYPSF|nr:hypothetical protein HYPSUDRAFT_1045683 [Hypholoma sublateritium FD-334 SS-4]